MRIAFNALFLESTLSQNTGTGQYARHLLEALQRVAPDARIECVEPSSRGDLAKLKFEQIDFPRAAKRMKADVAFVPYWAPPLKCDAPVAVTIHDLIQIVLPDYRHGWKQKAYFSLVRAATANASAILTDSEASKRDILRYIDTMSERVNVVPLATEPRFSPAQSENDLWRVREKYRLPEQYVLYLGGFDPRKNIETLMQVYVWAGGTIGDEFPLVVTGDAATLVTSNGGEKMSLAQMAKTLEIEEDIRFVGHVDENDKPALYAMARAFLYPTTYEGFGLPALEAMASGVPVVGSNTPAVAEVVGGGGMLVDPMNARKMAGALIAVCTDEPLHERLRNQALIRASQFSWDRTAIETMTVLRGIVR
jgi:glycosyltransferase involved in cell wall biosynthesis